MGWSELSEEGSGGTIDSVIKCEHSPKCDPLISNDVQTVRNKMLSTSLNANPLCVVSLLYVGVINNLYGREGSLVVGDNMYGGEDWGVQGNNVDNL